MRFAIVRFMCCRPCSTYFQASPRDGCACIAETRACVGTKVLRHDGNLPLSDPQFLNEFNFGSLGQFFDGESEFSENELRIIGSKVDFAAVTSDFQAMRFCLPPERLHHFSKLCETDDLARAIECEREHINQVSGVELQLLSAISSAQAIDLPFVNLEPVVIHFALIS